MARTPQTLLGLAAAAAALGLVARLDAQTSWILAPGVQGDWYDAANWSAGVPASGTAALINNGGITAVSTGGATARAFPLSIGTGPLDSGSLNMTGGTLSTGVVYIGESGTGTLTFFGGSIVSTVIVGRNVGSNGTILLPTVATLGASTTVGQSGNGTLIQSSGTITGGLTLGQNAGSAGTFLFQNGFCSSALTIGIGTVLQSAGTSMRPLALSLNQGDFYRISGGDLVPSQFRVGTGSDIGSTVATFVQAGGNIGSTIMTMQVGTLSDGIYQKDDGALNARSLQIGTPASAAGTFTQNGGSCAISEGVVLNALGTLRIGGGTFASGTLSAFGSIVQTGGTNIVIGPATLNAGSQYLLSGGSFLVGSGLFGSGATINFGGGSAEFDYGSLVDLGSITISNTSSAKAVGGPGSLLIVPPGFDPVSAFGSFTTAGLVHTAGTTLVIPAGIGLSLNGTLNDPVVMSGTLTGSALTVAGGLQVNSGASGSVGTVLVNNLNSGISGGVFQTTRLFIAQSASARFAQSGGSLTVTQLLVGSFSGNAGTYSMSGGSLNAGSMRVFTGSVVDLTGGTASIQSVMVDPGGTFRLNGGALNVTSNFLLQGNFDFAGATQTLTAAALFDFAQGTILNAGSTTLIGSSNSLLIFPPGFDPATQFGSFSSQGIVHTAGTPLVVAAGQSFTGSGTITDHVELSGTLNGVRLVGGLTVLPGGAGSLTSVDINDLTSGMSGGSISVSTLTIARTSPGRFLQTAGTLKYDQLIVSAASGSAGTGTYQLDGGTLTDRSTTSSKALVIGSIGAGTFIQNGGLNDASFLQGIIPTSDGTVTLGGSPGSSGWYEMAGGQFTVSNLTVGSFGVGTMRQTGGTVTCSSLTIGKGSAIGSSYQLEAGTLSIASLTVSSSRSINVNVGTFLQSGGSVSATQMDLAGGAKIGAFRKSSGFASIDTINNEGIFVHDGGTLSFKSVNNNSSGQTTLGGMLLWTGLTTFRNNGAQSVATFNADAGAVSKNLDLLAFDGSIMFNASQHLHTLFIGNGHAELAAGSLVVNTGSLGIPTSGGGFLNVTNGAIVIDYSLPTASPLPSVRNGIRSGFVRSTLSDATHTLGLAEASTIFTSFPAIFRGETVDNSSVLVRYTVFGDADLDGDADGVDIGRWAVNFTGELGGGPTATRTWSQGDWDYDGDVDGVDAGLWATAFTGELGGSGAGLSSVVVDDPSLSRQATQILEGLGVTVVPEPASILLTLSGAAWSLQRPRLRRTRQGLVAG